MPARPPDKVSMASASSVQTHITARPHAPHAIFFKSTKSFFAYCKQYLCSKHCFGMKSLMSTLRFLLFKWDNTTLAFCKQNEGILKRAGISNESTRLLTFGTKIYTEGLFSSYLKCQIEVMIQALPSKPVMSNTRITNLSLRVIVVLHGFEFRHCG